MTYTITTGSEFLEFEDFTAAREKAQEITSTENVELQVVHAATDAVCFVTTPVPAGQRFTPWTRVELPRNLIGDHPAPVIAGFIPAYTRVRVLGTAYRGQSAGTGWCVHDGRSNGVVYTKNTKETAHVFTEMRLGRVL